jgi:hypothetical protein
MIRARSFVCYAMNLGSVEKKLREVHFFLGKLTAHERRA